VHGRRSADIVDRHHADSGTRGEKFERDLRLLSEDFEREPHNGRTVFYLAQTHRDLGRLDDAIRLYERRGVWAAGTRRRSTRYFKSASYAPSRATGRARWRGS
jgi:hypothetical protein